MPPETCWRRGRCDRPGEKPRSRCRSQIFFGRFRVEMRVWPAIVGRGRSPLRPALCARVRQRKLQGRPASWPARERASIEFDGGSTFIVPSCGFPPYHCRFSITDCFVRRLAFADSFFRVPVYVCSLARSSCFCAAIEKSSIEDRQFLKSFSVGVVYHALRIHQPIDGGRRGSVNFLISADF